MQRYHLLFSGRVQGVGFRYLVSRTARIYGLTGTVTNLPDGRVEAQVQGSETAFSAFLETVRRGNGHSDIHGLDIKLIPTKPRERDFEII